MPFDEYLNEWARYKAFWIYSSRSEPPFSELEMSLLPPAGSEAGVWFQLAVLEAAEPRYVLKMLTRDLEFLSPGSSKLDVERYVFWEAEGPALEYVDISTGGALLPGFQFGRNLLPHASEEDPERPFFHVGSYLGHPIRISERGKGALDRVEEPRRLMLNPRLTIGTGRNFRDVEGSRLYNPREPIPEERPEYTWKPFGEEEYTELIQEVGMNIFTIGPEQREYVMDRPVFFINRNLEGARIPEMLYRSNFKGVTMFMDEPAVIIRETKEASTPQEAANMLVEGIRRYADTGKTYGSRSLLNGLGRLGYDLGDLDLLEEYPVWETATSAIWYEFKAGLKGYVHESRFQPGHFSRGVKDAFDLEYPGTPEACMDFHYAWFRGAARHFGRPWGMAIYGQMDLDAARIAFQRAYDQGAEYLWFWTSDHEHHVPYPEQKEHTMALREHEASNPRPPVDVLLHAARTAIALPYGYHLDELVMDKGCMWRNEERLGLDEENATGTSYRDVLRVAMKEVVTCLEEGTLFDLVYHGGGEELSGYERLLLVGEDGKVSRNKV